MTRTYMVVYERVAEDNWGAWAPDIGGAVGAGDSLDLARESLRKGIHIMLEYALEQKEPLPGAASKSVDFSAFEPPESQYVIEWMTIELPEAANRSEEFSRQAA